MDAFGGFTYAALSEKHIPVVVAAMIYPSLIKSLQCLITIKTTHLLIGL